MDGQLQSVYTSILYKEPDLLTDQDLLKIPLSILSKNLNPVGFLILAGTNRIQVAGTNDIAEFLGIFHHCFISALVRTSPPRKHQGH